MIDCAITNNSSRREGATALDDSSGYGSICKTIPLLLTETPSEQPKSIGLPPSLPPIVTTPKASRNASEREIIMKMANAFPVHAQRSRILRSNYVNQSTSEAQQHKQQDNSFSIEKYGDKTTEKEECEEQLLTEYATMLGFYLTSVAVLTGLAKEQGRLKRRFGLLDLALLGIATHKLSRIISKDRITSIVRAPFVSYIRSAGAGEVEEEPRGRGIQRGIGHLISCPYCVAPWSATALAFGLLFAPRVTRFFTGILASVAISDFLHRAYLAAKENT